jgi:hypothetical protein
VYGYIGFFLSRGRSVRAGRVVVTPGSLGWESNYLPLHQVAENFDEMGTFLLVVETNFHVSRIYVSI